MVDHSGEEQAQTVEESSSSSGREANRQHACLSHWVSAKRVNAQVPRKNGLVGRMQNPKFKLQVRNLKSQTLCGCLCSTASCTKACVHILDGGGEHHLGEPSETGELRKEEWAVRESGKRQAAGTDRKMMVDCLYCKLSEGWNVCRSTWKCSVLLRKCLQGNT